MSNEPSIAKVLETKKPCTCGDAAWRRRKAPMDGLRAWFCAKTLEPDEGVTTDRS